MNLTPEQKKKLLRAAKIADEGEVGVFEELTILDDKIEETAQALEAEIQRVHSSLKDALDQLPTEPPGQGPQGIQGLTGDTGPAGRDGVDGRDGKDGANGKDGKDGANGVDGKDADETAIVQKLEAELPQFGAAFRDGLELLQGEERLDPSAIKGLDAREAKLSKDTLDRAISIIDNRSSYSVQRVQKLEDRKIDGYGVHSIYVQATAPSNPQVGDLWVETV